MNDMTTIHADSIERYNRCFGFETHHPEVGVVRFDRMTGYAPYRMLFGIYALFLKKTAGCVIDYGKTVYDFDDDTVVAFGPGQTVGVHRPEQGAAPESIGVLFHPDLLHGTALAAKMNQYTFFSYASTEALHLSAEERMLVQDYMEKIERELQHPVDKFSKALIVSNLETLLNYCMRFYERQFATRSELNHDTLNRFEKLLDDYLDSGAAAEQGTPTVKYFADRVCLSPNYFGDLVKQVTGRTAQEHIRQKMIDVAKVRILDPACNVKQIAEALGFRHPQHFARFFKRMEGCTPKAFRDRAAIR